MQRLLIRPGAIGDLIVSLPALEFLRADYTEIWTEGRNVPLIRFADRVRSIAGTGLDVAELGRAPEPLWQDLGRFDSIVSWYGSSRREFREAVAALPFTFHPALPMTGAGVHAVDYYLAQVGAPPGAVPRIPVEAADKAAERIGGTVAMRATNLRGTSGGVRARVDCPTILSNPAKPLAVMHPFSGSPKKKNWPLGSFRRLAGDLTSQGWDTAWTAGPEELLDDATRFDDLYDLACWLASASIYIGNDSGISHLAAAVGIPTIAIFGPASDAAVWSPRGPNVRVVETADLAALPAANILRVVSQLDNAS